MTHLGPPDPLLRLFLEHPSLTRADVLELTGHARSTLGPRLEMLKESGMLVSARSDVPTGGRRPAAFALNTAAAGFLVIDVGPGHIRLALTDFGASIHADWQSDVGMTEVPEDTFAIVEEGLKELSVRYNGPQIAGCTVSLPAPIDALTGRPRLPPRSPLWDGYDVVARVNQLLTVPVTVERNSNLWALGEFTMDRTANANMLYIHASTWVGAGAIVEGKLVRGSRGEVGHIGHVKADWTDNDLCMCGNRGCLEAVASGVSLLREFGEKFETNSTAELVEHARRGDARLLAAIREIGRKVGLAAAGYVSVMNPGRIALGGTLAKAASEYASGVREGVHSRAFPHAAEGLVISTATAGADAAILGATAVAIETFMNRGTTVNEASTLANGQQINSEVLQGGHTNPASARS